MKTWGINIPARRRKHFLDGDMLWSGHGGDLPPSFTSADVDSVVCKKTVLDWLQTSFHYEHLPYIRMHSVFKNGEGYSRGCMRCARPFFE